MALSIVRGARFFTRFLAGLVAGFASGVGMGMGFSPAVPRRKGAAGGFDPGPFAPYRSQMLDMPAAISSPTVYLDAVLSPNDSLSRGAFAAVMGAIIAVSLVSSVMFLAMGATPVVWFFGLDILALYLAFRWHRKRSVEQTRVVVTAEAIALHHRDRRGRERNATVPSGFARIVMDQPVTPSSHLRIEHGNTAFIIGRFLTPDERAGLADALRAALRKARAERYGARPAMEA
ncbi:MAG: DUF2244 domain-containing protein [Pseudomonadota bacterium]